MYEEYRQLDALENYSRIFQDFYLISFYQKFHKTSKLLLKKCVLTTKTSSNLPTSKLSVLKIKTFSLFPLFTLKTNNTTKESNEKAKAHPNLCSCHSAIDLHYVLLINNFLYIHYQFLLYLFALPLLMMF